ncbi:hypothetical protein [Alkalicoccus luteus]|uniref:Uncharacterized protein n=1 Tax=Alkalicoccus luteus TaxID=1237094 RepID=A0A969PRC4_9BACI|nr:hypothetical protein [Alkalicoccus luteus]NJP36139.1 hypothetical protein [Alkalicoccus luteus]
MQTTELIERSMHLNHGYSFQEYEQCIERKLTVERRRSRSYQEGLAQVHAINQRIR